MDQRFNDISAANDELNELDQIKREKVFNAAKELFSRFGFRKTSVDEIAELAGISKRTLYQVFASKEKVLAELVMYEALSFRHSSLGQIKHMSDPVEKLSCFCALSAEYFESNPFLGRVVSDDSNLFSPFLGDELLLVEQGIKDILARLISEGIQKGAFRSMDAAQTVECVFALFRSFTYQGNWPGKDAEGEIPGWVGFINHAIAAK